MINYDLCDYYDFRSNTITMINMIYMITMIKL